MKKREQFLKVVESINDGQRQTAAEQCIDFNLTTEDLVDFAQETENDSPEMFIELIYLTKIVSYKRAISLWEITINLSKQQ